MCPSQPLFSVLRLRVVADTDPGAIARVLERFQNLNVIPRRVSAEFGVDDRLHIEVDVCGVPRDQMDLIAGKVRNAVSVTCVYWHPL
jgi:hypothetical protein